MKKLFSVLTALTMIVCSSVNALVSFAEDDSHIIGDVNGDGIITATDYEMVLIYYAASSSTETKEELYAKLEEGPNAISNPYNNTAHFLGSISEEQTKNIELYGDFNGDGIINAVDVSEMLTICTGDVNDDGKIDSSDASKILASYTETSSGHSITYINEKIADFNSDGVVNASDASAVLAYYAKLSSGQIK